MFTAEDFPIKQSKSVDLFVGRFQPVTIAHEQIMNSMSSPVIAVVRGNKSSRDLNKNPFPYDYQVKLINMVRPGVRVIEVKTGYVPEIIAQLRVCGLEVRRLYCGTDRQFEYSRQISKINTSLPVDSKIECELKIADRTGSHVSATSVRTSLYNGDFYEFSALTPKNIVEEYKDMKQIVEDAVAAGPVTNTVGGGAIADKQKPMDASLQRRKTFSDFRKDIDSKKS